MCEISAKEFNRRIQTGEYVFDKKGRIKEQELLPEFKKIISDTPTPIAIGTENKKIKGAKKCEWKGIKFDSHLEMYFYIYLTDLKIPFIHQSKYLLQEGFKFNGKSIRPITWTPDFDFGTFIIDTKGHPTQQVQLRIKMFLDKYRVPVYIFKTKNDFNKIHELWKNYHP